MSKPMDLAINVDITGIIDASQYMYNFAHSFKNTDLKRIYSKRISEYGAKFGDVVDEAAGGMDYMGKSWNVFHVYRWPDGVKANKNTFTERNRLWFDARMASGAGMKDGVSYYFKEDDSMIPMPWKWKSKRSRHVIIDKANRYENTFSEEVTAGQHDPYVITQRAKQGKVPTKIPVVRIDSIRYYARAKVFYSQGPELERAWNDFHPNAFIRKAPLYNKSGTGTVKFGYGTMGQFRLLARTFWAANASAVTSLPELAKVAETHASAAFNVINMKSRMISPIVKRPNQVSTLFTYNGKHMGTRSSIEKMTQSDRKTQMTIKRSVQIGFG